MSSETVSPAFPVTSYGGRRIAYSAAARAAAGAGAPLVIADPDSREAKAIRAAGVALVKAMATVDADPDRVILAILAAAAQEADHVAEDRKVVQSVQVRAAAARAANGEYRARKAAR